MNMSPCVPAVADSAEVAVGAIDGRATARARRALGAGLGVAALLALAGAAHGQAGTRTTGATTYRTTGLASARSMPAVTSDAAGLRGPVIDLTRQARLRRPGQVLPGDPVTRLPAQPDQRERFVDELPPLNPESARREPVIAFPDVPAEERDTLEPSPGTLAASADQPDGWGHDESATADDAFGALPELNTNNPGIDQGLSGEPADRQDPAWPSTTVRSVQISESVTVTDLGVDGIFDDGMTGLVAAPVVIDDATIMSARSEPLGPAKEETLPDEFADRPRAVAMRDELATGTESMNARPTESTPLATEPELVPETTIAMVTEAEVVSEQRRSAALLDDRVLVARPEAYPQPATDREPGTMRDPVVELDDRPRVVPRTPAPGTPTAIPASATPANPGTGTAVREPVIAPDGVDRSRPNPLRPATVAPTAGATPTTPATATRIDPAFPVGPVRDSVIDLAGPGSQPPSALDRAVEMYTPDPILEGSRRAELGEREGVLAPSTTDQPAPVTPAGLTGAVSVVLVEGAISNVQWRSVGARGVPTSDWATPRVGEERPGTVEIRTGVGTAVRVRLDDRSMLEIDRMTRATVTAAAQAEGFGSAPARVEVGRGRVRLLAAGPGVSPSATIVTPDRTFDLQTSGTVDYSAFVGSRQSAGE